MLTGRFFPVYVDRFACDWHRLATTDPNLNHGLLYAEILKNASTFAKFLLHTGRILFNCF